MANNCAVNLGNKRHAQLPGIAQCVDNELFGMARVGGIQKRGYRYHPNGGDIGGSLRGNLYFHHDGLRIQVLESEA